VLRDRLQEGLRAGVVAAAATAGTLIGLGFARGAPVMALNAIAHTALGTRAFVVRDAEPVVTLTGALLHVLSVVVWSVIFAVLAGWLRAGWAALAAGLFAAAVAAADLRLLPDRLAPGFARLLSPAELALVYIVLALALASWFGFRRRAPSARDPSLRRAVATI
jgi:hypothetical protein